MPEAPQETERSKKPKEDERQNELGIDPAQDVASRHPAPVDQRETLRISQSWNDEEPSRQDCPQARVPTMKKHRRQANGREDTSNHQSKRA